MKPVLIALAAAVVLPLHAQNTVSVRLYSRSLALNPTTAVNRTGGASYNLNFTTFDPKFNLPLFVPAVGSNGNIVVSSELKQRATPGIYETTYSFWQGTSMVQDGLLVMRLPAVDLDRNRIRDLIQMETLFYAGSTGLAHNIFPSTNDLKFEARLSRDAGNAVGAYSGLIYGTGASYVFNGAMNVLAMDGTANYWRGSTNRLELNLVRIGKRGEASALAGTATYKATTNHIILSSAVFTDELGRNYSITNGTLLRVGKRYVGSVHFADGDLETPWPDFNNWVMEVIDENDASGNLIPDISDPAEVPDDRGPLLAITVPKTSVRAGSQPITLRGTAKDRAGVEAIEVRVENAEGSTEYTLADGTTRWAATVDTLIPGRNIVWIRAWDSLGNYSEAARVIVYTGE